MMFRSSSPTTEQWLQIPAIGADLNPHPAAPINYPNRSRSSPNECQIVVG